SDLSVVFAGPRLQRNQIARSEEIVQVGSVRVPNRKKRPLNDVQVMDLVAKGDVFPGQRADGLPLDSIRPFHVPIEIPKRVDQLHATASGADWWWSPARMRSPEWPSAARLRSCSRTARGAW